MSRSYRHTPIHGITTARSEKDDKRLLNGIWRARTRSILTQVRRMHVEDIDAMLLPEDHDEIMNRWSMAKDGRRCWGFGGFGDRYPAWKVIRK